MADLYKRNPVRMGDCKIRRIVALMLKESTRTLPAHVFFIGYGLPVDVSDLIYACFWFFSAILPIELGELREARASRWDRAAGRKRPHPICKVAQVKHGEAGQCFHYDNPIR